MWQTLAFGENKMKLRHALILLGVLTALGLIIACLVLVFFAPSNDRDNADIKMRPEMIKCTLTWGRLAKFPESAKDFNIYTEGNSFTRTFRGSYSDTPENIKNWLRSSPGVTEGKREESKIILKTGEGAAYGEITVSPDGSHVTFRVSWS
jgi:hypothetical protein